MKHTNFKRKVFKDFSRELEKICDCIYQHANFDKEVLGAVFDELGKHLEDIQDSHEVDDSFLQRYMSACLRLADAYDASDWILIADILHHEFAENLLQGKIYESVEDAVQSDDPVSIFQKNDDAFFNRYGKRLSGIEKEKKFIVKKALDGTKIVYALGQDEELRLASLYDPTYEALKWAEKYIKLPNVKTTLVIQGLLTGYFLRSLRHGLRSNVDFIVYETSEDLFNFVVRNFNLSDLFTDSKIEIILKSDGRDVLHNAINASLYQKSNIIGIVCPYYRKDEEFEKVCLELHTNDEAEDGFRKYSAKGAFKNTLHALCSLERNYLVSDFLLNLPKEVPVFLVAGGPSLLKNVEELKRVKGRGLIVAVDRAVSVLLKNGIRPDMMVTVDPDKDPGFLDYPDAAGAYLMCAYCATIKSQDMYDGHLVFIHSDVRDNEIPGLNGRLLNFGDVGGGVAPAAFIHFLYMKVNNLVLVGQDLAIESEMTHADGRNDKFDEASLIDVDGIYGETVKTRWDFDRFRIFMEMKIREYPETTVIDATEGGALIRGTVVKELHDAIGELCVKNWNIQGIFSEMQHGQTTKEHLDTIAYMQNRVDELQIIKSLCKELVEYCRKFVRTCMYGDVGDKKFLRDVNKMNEIRNQIYAMRANDWLEDFWVTDKATVPDTLFVIKTNEEALPVFKNALKYYQNLPHYCDTLSEAIREEFKINELESRKTEHVLETLSFDFSEFESPTNRSDQMNRTDMKSLHDFISAFGDV